MEKKNPSPPLAPDIRDALVALLTYLWEDEKRNYKEEPGPPHIFPKLQRIREWLDEQEN